MSSYEQWAQARAKERSTPPRDLGAAQAAVPEDDEARAAPFSREAGLFGLIEGAAGCFIAVTRVLLIALLIGAVLFGVLLLFKGQLLAVLGLGALCAGLYWLIRRWHF